MRGWVAGRVPWCGTVGVRAKAAQPYPLGSLSGGLHWPASPEEARSAVNDFVLRPNREPQRARAQGSHQAWGDHTCPLLPLSCQLGHAWQ